MKNCKVLVVACLALCAIMVESTGNPEENDNNEEGFEELEGGYYGEEPNQPENGEGGCGCQNPPTESPPETYPTPPPSSQPPPPPPSTKPPPPPSTKPPPPPSSQPPPPPPSSQPPPPPPSTKPPPPPPPSSQPPPPPPPSSQPPPPPSSQPPPPPTEACPSEPQTSPPPPPPPSSGCGCQGNKEPPKVPLPGFSIEYLTNFVVKLPNFQGLFLSKCPLLTKHEDCRKACAVMGYIKTCLFSVLLPKPGCMCL